MSTKPQTVLVVEDEASIASFVAAYLKNAGYDVRTAATGSEALTQVTAREPALVILDLMLPDLDGFGVCEILRRDPLTAMIPIIIVSAWASTDSRHLGLELGALDYITKPFSPPELVKRVNRLLLARAG